MACRSYGKYMAAVLSEQVRDISAELLWEDDVQVLSGLDISECLVEFILGHLDVFYLTLTKFYKTFLWISNLHGLACKLPLKHGDVLTRKNVEGWKHHKEHWIQHRQF